MAVSVIGDLHGYLDVYESLLQRGGFCDDSLGWTGGDRNLWLIGDLFDRGTRGLGCLDLTMKLQQEAAQSGGSVNTILGNHELMLLCAYKFGNQAGSTGMKMMDQWMLWGGVETDLTGLTEEHVDWLGSLPLLHKVESSLLMHADAMMYIHYGRSVEEVNSAFKTLMSSDDLEKWIAALGAFTEHRAFSELALTGVKRAEQVLKYFSAEHLVHGHTPISFSNHTPAEEVIGAWTYANSLCTNVDGGIYLGGPGFIYEMEEG